MIDPTIGYTTEGGIAGGCGHVHRTAIEAYDCADGHHSDRRVVAVYDGGSFEIRTRPLSKDEALGMFDALHNREMRSGR